MSEEEVTAVANERPTAATVIAIISLVFGGFGVIFGLIGLGAFKISVLSGSLSLISLLISSILVGAGVTLLLNKKIALLLSNVYVFGNIAYAVANFIYFMIVLRSLGSFGTGMAIFGLIIGVAYPLVIFFVLLKNESAVTFYEAQA